MLRRWSERLLGTLVRKCRLPPDMGGGPIFISGRAGGMKYVLRAIADCDAELLRIARLLVRRGDTVWDIGANLGLFSCAAAHFAGAAGEVFAIEPDRDVVALLARTAAAQDAEHAPIRVIPTVISDRAGLAHFAIAARARAANALQDFGTTQMGGVAESRLLPALTLDVLLEDLKPPQVLKIDVEGAETKVLGGATTLLRFARPAIHIEVSAESRAAVTQLLRAHDYRLWDGATFDGSEGGQLAAAADNTVAIPAEKLPWKKRP